MNHKIADLFNIQRRFLRSAHLERDFRDASALDGYVVTRQVNQNLERIVQGLDKKSGQRAWRITGDYGSGKSSFALLLQANTELIAREKADGILIILDELGKFLEFAALHPERQDIFLLQQLAELSTRSSREPLFTIGLLHQGFSAYADQLSQSAQKEWEKVAGRFEELLFDQPLDQITHLITSALNTSHQLYPRGAEARAKAAMRAATELGWFGVAAPVTSLVSAAPNLYPLHPTTIPVLVKLFSRFGQNERSLFSFLLSNEPFGLQSFAQQEAKADSFYRIHHLYDYAAANFGNRLSVQSYRNHWNHIDSLVRSFPSQNESDIAILKTVGLLNLLNAPELVPSEDSILLAASRTEADTAARSAIQRLHKESHVLYARGRQGGYCLWSHTSVNLDAAYEAASRAIGYSRGLIPWRCTQAQFFTTESC